MIERYSAFSLNECMDSEIQAKKKPPAGDLVFHTLMVPKAGIEPARLAAVDFESTASTDFATSARKGMRKTLGIIPLPSLHATTIRTDVMQVLKKSAPELTTSPPFSTITCQSLPLLNNMSGNTNLIHFPTRHREITEPLFISIALPQLH